MFHGGKMDGRMLYVETVRKELYFKYKTLRWILLKFFFIVDFALLFILFP